MSIPAIGPITALTWALEIGEVQRFSSIKKAISYCGLRGDERRSANSAQRTPISKQRNKHLQTMLIEAAKMAPRHNHTLALLYDREKQKGHANRARYKGNKQLNHMVDFEKSCGMSRRISDTAVSLPAPGLRAFINLYAGFKVSGLPPGLHFGLPSSDVDVIISLARPIDVVRMPNREQRPGSFSALVSGLQHAPAIVRQGGDAFGLHVFIKPLGVRAILGVGSADISSLVLNLSEIWGKRAGDLIDMLLVTDSWQQRFAILDRAFVSKLNPASLKPEISWAWRRLAETHGTATVQQLADKAGYSRRHFSELFRDAIGVAPKLAAQIFRFEYSRRLIADKRLSLADVAISCGYYDQAHLTHEWHALADCSPKSWIARELPFLQDYELGGRDNEPDDLGTVHQSFV